MNDRLLIELVPRLHVEEIKGLFAPPPFGEEAPLSAFCRTSVGEWDAFRSIDMDVEARFMQRMKQSSKQKNLVNEDESIVLNVIFLVVVIMLRTCVVSRLGSKNKMVLVIFWLCKNKMAHEDNSSTLICLVCSFGTLSTYRLNESCKWKEMESDKCLLN